MQLDSAFVRTFTFFRTFAFFGTFASRELLPCVGSNSMHIGVHFSQRCCLSFRRITEGYGSGGNDAATRHAASGRAGRIVPTADHLAQAHTQDSNHVRCCQPFVGRWLVVSFNQLLAL
jgi:hypothetical protein